MPFGYLACETGIVSLKNYRSVAPQAEFNIPEVETDRNNVVPVLSKFVFRACSHN